MLDKRFIESHNCVDPTINASRFVKRRENFKRSHHWTNQINSTFLLLPFSLSPSLSLSFLSTNIIIRETGIN